MIGTPKQQASSLDYLRKKSKKIHDKQKKHGVLSNPTNNFVYAIVQDPNDKKAFHTMAVTGQVVMNIGMEYLGTEDSLENAKSHIKNYLNHNYGPVFKVSADRKLTRVRL